MSNKFKIYTKTGDKGMTSLIGGKRVTKADIQVEAYGDIDEAKSHIAYLMDLMEEDELKGDLKWIIVKLFEAESIVAAISEEAAAKMPQLQEEDIQRLEQRIDALDEQLPALTAFVLPGGHPVNSYCHITRTVCRRAERVVLRLWQEKPELENVLVAKFLNRLSDYLFTLSRFYSIQHNIPEHLWISK
jgi:cob(I)alamin adenosyltransferase